MFILILFIYLKQDLILSQCWVESWRHFYPYIFDINTAFFHFCFILTDSLKIKVEANSIFSCLCSVHFEDNSFFTSSLGQVHISTTAVPSIFFFLVHLSQRWSQHTWPRRGVLYWETLKLWRKLWGLLWMLKRMKAVVPQRFIPVRCSISYSYELLSRRTVCHSMDHAYDKCELSAYRKQLKLQRATIRRLKK